MPKETPEVVKQLMAEVSDNPALVKWPRDEWGFTSELKKVLLHAAGNVRANSKKHDLLLHTLAVGIAHVQKRRAKDVGVYNSRKEYAKKAEQDRTVREQISSPFVALRVNDTTKD